MANYHLSIDLSTPVDNILLQCDRKIDIVEVAKNSAAVSFSECDEIVSIFCKSIDFIVNCMVNSKRKTSV